MKTHSRAARYDRRHGRSQTRPPRARAPRWRLAMTAVALFATSLSGGFLAAGGDLDRSADVAAELADERPARVVIDTPAETITGDDHGHQNPVLDLDVYPDQVRYSASGREVLELEVAITARAAKGMEYSYETAIEDDRGRSLRRQAAGSAWSLAAGKSALHPFAMPDDLGPGYYKAIFTASARGPDNASDQSRSVFFRIDRQGSVIPMDRTEWLEKSQATQGIRVPGRPGRGLRDLRVHGWPVQRLRPPAHGVLLQR